MSIHSNNVDTRGLYVHYVHLYALDTNNIGRQKTCTTYETDKFTCDVCYQYKYI